MKTTADYIIFTICIALVGLCALSIVATETGHSYTLEQNLTQTHE